MSLYWASELQQMNPKLSAEEVCLYGMMHSISFKEKEKKVDKEKKEKAKE